ncbi:MAG: metallopeptidase TldD-related protein [Bryobacteraceae bacterium]|nr:metallopeptidase TldD-related protein [Bryobacteraceae bacterium]
MRHAALLVAVLAAGAGAAAAQESPILSAMRQEMERSKALRIVSLDAPYYIEYALDDVDGFSASASFGGLIAAREARFRVPRVQVRVGDYKFDNTNYIFTDLLQGRGFDLDRWPLENDTAVLRSQLWLATDRAYKGALEAIARKRSALKNLAATPEGLDDFSKAPALRLLRPVPKFQLDRKAWTERVKSLSRVFSSYPAVVSGTVEFDTNVSASYYVNSEGAEVLTPEGATSLRIRAAAVAPDGMPVRDSAVVAALAATDLPDESTLRSAVVDVAVNVSNLVKAPMGENYSGPVLFEPVAAAQLFAQLLGKNLNVPRRPVTDPGRQLPFNASELDGRMGVRVLPEWMDAVDDPTQTEYRGRRLFGHYEVDMEGVAPQPVVLVEKGTLKDYLRTRQPLKGFEVSNGRGRLPGAFGYKGATFGNLFIKASQTVPADAMKRRLLEMVGQRGKPYGILVRKLDFPSTATGEELQRLGARLRSGGEARPVSGPLLVYRVFPDGREELVRGLRFRGLNVRALRDIVAASSNEAVFDYLENGAPWALTGAASYVSNNTVIAPGVLFEDLELERVEEQWPRPPLVPAPPLTPPR